MINLTKNFLIYGYGISGKSVAQYLKNKNSRFKIYDDCISSSKSNNFINKNFLKKNIKKFDYFVVSPSIKINKNHFLYPFKKKILLDLDFLSLELDNQTIIGVTGTEGKSTTCQHLSQTINRKYKNIILGNFGNTILDKKNIKIFLKKIDIIIIELSSYQLDKVKLLKLDHAIITNIYSDHIKYHNTFNNYVKTKFKIQSILKKNGSFHLRYQDFNLYKKFIKFNNHQIFKLKSKKIAQEDLSYQINILNAPLIKSVIKIIDNTLTYNLKDLKNLPFRNQLIKKDKIKIYNDSKCTNLENAIKKNNLIKSNNKILILGGIPKINKKKFVINNTLALIFGPHNNEIVKNIIFKNSKYIMFQDLKNLLHFIKIINANYKYDNILFSPGGESFDQYKDFIERGKSFNQILRKLKF